MSSIFPYFAGIFMPFEPKKLADPLLSFKKSIEVKKAYKRPKNCNLVEDILHFIILISEIGPRGRDENKTAMVQNYANKVHIGLYYENGRELTLTLISRHLCYRKMAILAYFSKMSQFRQ